MYASSSIVLKIIRAVGLIFTLNFSSRPLYLEFCASEYFSIHMYRDKLLESFGFNEAKASLNKCDCSMAQMHVHYLVFHEFS